MTGFLNHDPNNLKLIGDACAAALDARSPDIALQWLAHHEEIAPLPPTLLNLKGLAALQQDRFGDATAIFESLLVDATDDPGLRYNLAWARTMTGEHERALSLLDEATTTAIPAAAALKVQTLHRLGDMESALRHGIRLMRHHPDDTALMGALSLLAIDMRMPEQAQTWATQSQNTADGLSAMGTLSLQSGDMDQAMAFFERGLAVRPDSARNLLGKGLVLMAGGEASDAARYLDRSAESFGSHLGTWIAAGWAHFADGDHARARAVFEHGLALDDTFAESHGALAVLDIVDGKIDSGRRRMEVALRLDRRGFAGALAQMLLLEHDGDPASARQVRSATLNTPMASGLSIAQAMIRIAPRRRGNK